MLELGYAIFIIFIFPGLLFQLICALTFEWLDRKLLARFQRRVGPRFLQPLIDFIKLLGKENIKMGNGNEFFAAVLPLISLAAVLTASIYIPIAGFSAMSFEGDLIVVLFLLSIPTLAYFLAGVVSEGVYSIIGGGRSLLQYFSYEVPLIIALSGPAIMAGSWSVRSIMSYQAGIGSFIFYQPLGFLLALVGLIGKLKRDPLDIPKAKSEVVGGPLTEYTGAKLAVWHLGMNIQAVIGIFLLINLYLGATIGDNLALAIVNFSLEALALVVILSVASAIFARLRIDQLASLGWRILVPLGLLQLVFVILMRV